MASRNLLLIGFLWLTPSLLFCQEIDRKVIGSAYSSSNLGEWHLGETIIGDFVGRSGILHCGFIQGDQVVTVPTDQPKLDFSFNAFPNPTTGVVHLHHDAIQAIDLQVYDMLGCLRISKEKIASIDQILLNSLPSGIYLLRYGTRGGSGKQLIVKTH